MGHWTWQVGNFQIDELENKSGESRILIQDIKRTAMTGLVTEINFVAIVNGEVNGEDIIFQFGLEYATPRSLTKQSIWNNPESRICHNIFLEVANFVSQSEVRIGAVLSDPQVTHILESVMMFKMC